MRGAEFAELNCFLNIAIALTVCGGAAAQDSFALAYEAPAGCPSLEWIRSEVKRLAPKRTQAYSAALSIDNRRVPVTARIVAHDGTERSLSGTTCAEVGSAAAVVLALAITPLSQQGGVPSPRAVEPPAQRASGAELHTSTPNYIELGLGSALDLGTMPRLDLGLSARLGLGAHVWSARVEGSYWLPQRASLPSAPDVAGDFSWWSLSGSGCLAARPQSPRIELCLGPELGRIDGRGRGTSNTAQAGAFRLGVLAQAEVEVPLSRRLRLYAGLGATALFYGRHAFMIQGLGTIYRPVPVSGRATLGGEVVF